MEDKLDGTKVTRAYCVFQHLRSHILMTMRRITIDMHNLVKNRSRESSSLRRIPPRIVFAYLKSSYLLLVLFILHNRVHLPLYYRSSQDFLFKCHLCIRDHPTNHLLSIFHVDQKFFRKDKAHVTFKRRKTMTPNV